MKSKPAKRSFDFYQLEGRVMLSATELEADAGVDAAPNVDLELAERIENAGMAMDAANQSQLPQSAVGSPSPSLIDQSLLDDSPEASVEALDFAQPI
ncbi:MAG: hypothetical protein AAF664_12945, partial [Planctomycetota bacterium]